MGCCKKLELLEKLISEIKSCPCSCNEQETKSTVLSIAEEELGVEEIPRGSNDGERVREYLRAANTSVPAPWCAAFVVWCQIQAGLKPFITAHVATMWDKNKDKQHKAPKAGDVFVMLNGQIGHCGFVHHVEGDTIYTIEGNTNDEGEREGYEVCKRIRKASSCRGFLRFPSNA